MALATAGDLIAFALRAATVTGVGQTPTAEDASDALVVLNALLAEWQINRWLVYDLVDVAATATGAASYQVGAGLTYDFSWPTGQRPDRIDAAFARLISTGIDTPLYPFMAREGYNRIAAKAAVGLPESYFYDSGATVGTLYFYPVPSSIYSLHAQAKASLGQYSGLTAALAVPQQYINALIWNLAAALRPLYGLPDEPSTSQRAAMALQSIGGSGAQMAQGTQIKPSRRAGIFSHVVAGGQGQQS